jgi:hypothetical protein
MSFLSEEAVPEEVAAERGWIALKLEGPFPFSMTGVLAFFVQPLAESRIPEFAFSTTTRITYCSSSKTLNRLRQH